MVPLLSPGQKLVQGFFALLWLAAVVFFWVWWLSPKHNIGLGFYVLNTIVLVWLTFVPLYFISLFIRAKITSSTVEPPQGLRVAMVVTKAPSEPFWVVRRTLEAMLAQDYPHHTWLADEDPAPSTLAWCAEHGVRVSTRKGVAEYHRSTWPRRTRCKEGNLAYFYDHHGYDNYEFVVQMDADHVPAPGYLREMLRPFADPSVGYVSAPSICDNNAGNSWAARGRLYAEALFHGLQQTIYNAGFAPLCIGSHYAVRTKALRDIGGLGPELAEDHSTTLMFNAHGWRGVHALRASAHGDGPETFADLITQEFQWSRSLVTILLQYSPTYVPRLPPRLRFQFLFCQLWYPLFAGFMLVMYLMPIVALARGQQYADVALADFYLHVGLAQIAILGLAWLWYRNGWARPVDARIISWEALLFLFAKWPWLIAGSLAAIRDSLTGSFVDFRITPKGQKSTERIPGKLLLPYAALSAVSGFAAILCDDVGDASGFYLFAIVNCAIYAILLLVVLVRHAVENGVSILAAPRSSAAVGALAALLVGLPVAGALKRGPEAIDSIFWGVNGIEVTEATYSAAGAGKGGDKIKQVSLVLRWAETDSSSSRVNSQRTMGN